MRRWLIFTVHEYAFDAKCHQPLCSVLRKEHSENGNLPHSQPCKYCTKRWTIHPMRPGPRKKTEEHAWSLHPSKKTHENPQVRIWRKTHYRLAECCNRRGSATPLLRYDIAEGSSFCRNGLVKKSAKKNTAQNQERRTDEYDRMRSIISIPFKRSCYLS